MKQFWKKQLPAALLALVMVMGMAPHAAAAKVSLKKEVDPGDEIAFSRTEFRDLFMDEEPDDRFSYLEFTEFAGLDEYGCFYAENDDGDWVSLDEGDLEDRWFYYNSDEIRYDGDCILDGLTFIVDDDADDGVLTLEFTMKGAGNRTVNGALTITIGDGKSGKPANRNNREIVYQLDEDDDITVDRDDFDELFEEYYDGFSYLRFIDSDNLDACGALYSYGYDEKKDDFYKITFDEDDITDGYFYFSGNDVEDDNYSCTLDDLTFAADDRTDGETVTLDFTLYGENRSKQVNGVLIFEIGDADREEETELTYEVDPSDEITFDRDDFDDLFEEEYNDFCYLRFTDADNLDACGYLYSCAYDEDDEEFHDVEFDEDDITDGYFYYSDSDVEDDGSSYTLSDLTFAADRDAGGKTVTLDFTLYGEDTSQRVYGTLTIEIGETTATSNYAGNIRYSVTTGANVQIGANDIARYYAKFFPTDSLQYVVLGGIPSTGSLYYNYYGASAYGATRTLLTAANAARQAFYFSPAANQYALTELTYVPSGYNYCAAIPFTAYGTASRSVTGTILISVTSAAVSEVYGATPRNTAVNFPASAIYNAVFNATGSALTSIQLLELPAAHVGTVYVGSSNSVRANTFSQYSYASGAYSISQLRFVPTSYYTGSVTIPYVALNSSGVAIASGVFALGVVNSVKAFSDMGASTWCYKYVTELSDAGVIDGYGDGSFKPNSTISYGAALKLIMLAAGYPEQAPTTSNVFSGYLAAAQADGLITRSDDVNLGGSITRLQVAQLATAALKLDTGNLPSVKPFNDTDDPCVQALNAAGIIEGYFANGVSSYRPGNTLTRGQVSAIVWRMYNYRR